MLAAIDAISGVKAVAFNYYNKRTNWVTDSHIGACLATWIASLAATSMRAGGAGKVIIVAHSMGGLAVRCAVDPECVNHDNAKGSPWQAADARQIALVITLGTPNLGSAVDAAGRSVLVSTACRKIGLCAQWAKTLAAGSPAAKAMQESSVNPETPSPELASLKSWPSIGVPLDAMAGRITITSSLFGRGPFCVFCQGELGDLAVSVPSAQAGATTAQSTTIDCGYIPVKDLFAGNGSVIAIPLTMKCWHNSEETYPAFQAEVVSRIKAAVNASRPGPSTVDWRNTTYSTTCGGAAPHPFTVTMQNGKGTAPGGNKDPYQHYDVQVEAVQRGDLIGGGGTDTAVLLYCAPEPSNFFLQDVQIFGPGNNLVAELPHVGTLKPPGSPLPPVYVPAELSISGGRLIAGMEFYATTDSHAGGPSLHRTLTWKWNGSQFVLQPPGISKIIPVTDLLQQLAMQDCYSNATDPGGCTPGGAKISSIDPRYGIGIADATGHHGTIYIRPSASSTAFRAVLNLGGDVPTCSQVKAAGVPTNVFTDLVGQACLRV
jgi:hypothetical protein